MGPDGDVGVFMVRWLRASRRHDRGVDHVGMSVGEWQWRLHQVSAVALRAPHCVANFCVRSCVMQRPQRHRRQLRPRGGESAMDVARHYSQRFSPGLHQSGHRTALRAVSLVCLSCSQNGTHASSVMADMEFWNLCVSWPPHKPVSHRNSGPSVRACGSPASNDIAVLCGCVQFNGASDGALVLLDSSGTDIGTLVSTAYPESVAHLYGGAPDCSVM